ncbi:TPA: hypothetical protein ACGF8G_003838, partial [Vibrio cholerae]
MFFPQSFFLYRRDCDASILPPKIQEKSFDTQMGRLMCLVLQTIILYLLKVLLIDDLLNALYLNIDFVDFTESS